LTPALHFTNLSAMLARSLITSFICLLGTFTVAAAEDWPEFRGPTGQGHAASARLPTEWSATRNVAWKQSIPGQGWSSPIVKGGRVYLTTAVGAEEKSRPLSLRVLGLDADTGKILWNSEVFSREPGSAPRGHTKNGQASPTPILAGGRLYVHFGHLGTACLDLDGKVIWRNDALHYPPVHGNGGSPVLVEDALIFSCDGASEPFVIALHKDTGKVLWKTERKADVKKSFSFSTPLVIEVDGRKQVISPGSGAVCGYDPRTGRELWRVRYGEGYSVIPRPVFGHGLLFLGTGYDRPTVMAVRPNGKGDVTDTHVAWTLTKGAPNTPSLLLVGAELYMVSDGGIASCVDARTGKVHWQERLGGNYSASPVFANGRIYFQNEEGDGVVVEPGKEFRKLATNTLGERSLASYAVGSDALFIRTEQNLYKIKGG